MPASIGVNLRVTGHCRQGGRKYMEDFFSVAYQQTEDEKDLEYAFFGIYDGHGGGEAATYAKEHLMESIIRLKTFWSDKDDDVLKAIKEGYISTHYAMWKEQEKWPKTASGLPSTAGTTASVAFIRRGKIYIGHVGDSGIILGYQEPGQQMWKARPLTKDHKPENEHEMNRIASCGGKVVTKSGVPRVVWNRPRIGHKGPVRRSTPIDEIPFLAVARSLGDLWSYNSALDQFVVSPDPDTCCIPIDASTFRCLIFGTDGLWNMISPAAAVSIVQVAEQHNEQTVLATADSNNQQATRSKVWLNPSKCLVERALERWNTTKMRADNTSVITLMLDPPGPPRAEVIKNQRMQLSSTPNRPARHSDIATENQSSPSNQIDSIASNSAETQPQETAATITNTVSTSPEALDRSNSQSIEPPPYPENGLKIVTVYRNEIPAPSSPPVPSTSSSSEVPESSEEVPMQQQHNSDLDYVDKSKSEVIVSNKSPDEMKVEDKEIIQINEVSSSSSDKPLPDESSTSCTRCTRSHDASRRLTRTSAKQLIRSSSESPKRKTRSSLIRRTITAGAKRERSGETSEEKPETTAITNSDSRLSDEIGELVGAEAAAQAAALNNNNTSSTIVAGCSSSEPPQKLRRSRSLEPRDFTLRSANVDGLRQRCLRDRERVRHSLTTSSPLPTAQFKRLSAGRSFTPLRSPIQTRNRVKRLSKN